MPSRGEVCAGRRPGCTFPFAPLQGSAFARTEGGRAAIPDTFILVDDGGRVLTKSDAAIHLLGRLGGLWRIVGAALCILPGALRNFGYDCVGRIRLRLFPRPAGLCPIIPDALRARFGT